MAGTPFRVFVILLALSHLICLKAVPVTRIESLMQGSQGQANLVLESNHKDEGFNERNQHFKEPTITERMNSELQDYSLSGPNGHHTPRVP